ncbi:hypothetical protein [Modestobacter sp. I12A-02662]|uniref:hypothetical protein n=1 Tax=Modestobacter sp. I12A-02662 TaxID=1730496 RepID=UPI0034DF8927
MSTDSTTPTGATPAPHAAAPDVTAADVTAPEAPAAEQPAAGTTTGAIGDGSPAGEDAEPGWVARHSATLITLMVAVIVAAAAITGLTLYRHGVDEANADTEAAFAEMVSGQGASLETVECDGGTCAAVINGAAYTVLVQEDDNGEQHFGVTDFVGD